VRTLECAAILFDLDGVLVDSTASVGRVWKRWAEQQGLDPDTVIRAAHGRRTIETIRLCAPHIDAEATLRIVEKMEIDDTPDLAVVDGARELLAAIPQGRWAVVTSGTRALATSRLKTTGLPVPAVVVTADDVSNGKPHPEPYLRGAERLGFEAGSCVVFEDTPAGIESGHAAGMRVVALTTTYPREKLRAAELIVPSLAGVQVTMTGQGLTLCARSMGAAHEL
jgi:mannitol-1-/sugar-/sorbitol-6-phosphatase